MYKLLEKAILTIQKMGFLDDDLETGKTVTERKSKG